MVNNFVNGYPEPMPPDPEFVTRQMLAGAQTHLAYAQDQNQRLICDNEYWRDRAKKLEEQLNNNVVHNSLPDMLLERDGYLYFVRSKPSGRVELSLSASFTFDEVFSVQLIGKNPEDIIGDMHHVCVVTPAEERLSFWLTQEEFFSSQLISVIKRKCHRTIYLKGSISQESEYLRNFLLSKEQITESRTLPFYPGFYKDETQHLHFAYGQAGQIASAICMSRFAESSEGINVGNLFQYVSNVYEHIVSSNTKIMLFLLLHDCVISSLINSKFAKNMPRIMLSCSSSKDSEYISPLLGGIFDIIQPDDKSLPEKLQKMKDGAVLINFSPEHSKYLNMRRYEYVVSLLEGKEEENINDVEIVLVNVKNTVSFTDELVIKLSFSFDNWELDPTVIRKNIQIYLKMFITWITKRYPHGMEKELEKWQYTNFRGKWSFVLRIVREFYEKMKENLPNFMYRADMALAQLMDIDPTDDFNNDLICIQKELTKQLTEGSIQLVSQRRQRSFLVESERGYLNNIYLREDCLYINNRFFKKIFKECVGYNRFGDFLKGMQDSRILLDTELIHQGRSQKISISCKKTGSVVRLNVWKFSRELLPQEINELI